MENQLQELFSGLNTALTTIANSVGDLKQDITTVKEQNKELKQDITTVKEQNKELKKDNIEIKEQNKELKQDNIEIKERLDRIEKNTIIIRDRVINDFNGISDQTKYRLEEEGEKVVEIKEEIIELDNSPIWNTKSTKYYSPEAKKARKESQFFSISEIVNSYNPPQSDGFYLGSDGNKYSKMAYLSACGNWVSKIMSIVLEYKITRRYPEQVRGLVDTLVSYWIYEREENGRMY